jgi:hypothetical protein
MRKLESMVLFAKNYNFKIRIELDPEGSSPMGEKGKLIVPKEERKHLIKSICPRLTHPHPTLQQGSQTQIYPRATFQRKKAPRAAFLRK